MANAKTDSSSDAKPRKVVIDVTEPGKSAPSPSAKPIIVTNRPVLKQDPMMVPDGEVSSGEPPKPISRVAKSISIKPLTSDVGAASAPSVPKADDEALETPPPKAEKIPSEDTKKPDIKPPEPIQPDEPATASPPEEPKPQPASDTVEPPQDEKSEGETDGQLAPNKALEDAKKKEEEAKVARAAEQEKIIESKKYFLLINSAEKRRANLRAVLLLVVVILATLAWLDLSLDAGILKINGLHPVTHLFSK
jgi:hypothetical protein